jgi:ABC-type multidrug transport system permease subunit
MSPRISLLASLKRLINSPMLMPAGPKTWPMAGVMAAAPPLAIIFIFLLFFCHVIMSLSKHPVIVLWTRTSI